jgi:hypothetical protein
MCGPSAHEPRATESILRLQAGLGHRRAPPIRPSTIQIDSHGRICSFRSIKPLDSAKMQSGKLGRPTNKLSRLTQTRSIRWPSGGSVQKRLRPVLQLQILEQQRMHDLQDEARLFNAPVPQIAPAGASEEVRRNRATFDFIVKSNLWYQQGQIAAFKQQDQPSD